MLYRRSIDSLNDWTRIECTTGFTETSQSMQLVLQLMNIVESNMFANQLPVVSGRTLVVPEQFNYSCKTYH